MALSLSGSSKFMLAVCQSVEQTELSTHNLLAVCMSSWKDWIFCSHVCMH